jgi:thermitase
MNPTAHGIPRGDLQRIGEVKPHIQVKLADDVRTAAAVPYWEDLIADKSLAVERFHPPIDVLLARRDVPVWVTHEYRPQAESFGREEIAAGLNRIYRLILQRDAGIPAGLAEEIALLPSVEYARPGAIAVTHLPDPQAAAFSVTTDRRSREAIFLSDAHLFTRGSPDVIVAVLDTGTELDHPELADALVAGYDFVNVIDGAGRFIGDFLDADPVPDDEVGHGTHVAGIIGAKGTNMPEGVVPRCRIMPVRVLGALERDGKRYGAGLIDNISTGIKFAVDNHADVINMSLGVQPAGAEIPHQEVVDYARAKGVTIVAAAGNDGSDANRYYPAALPYAIAVGAVDEGGDVASFSSYGEPVDFVAPGTNVYSSFLERGYAFSTGTSHATPFVAGGAALLRSYAHERGRQLSDSQVKNLLKHTADRIGAGFRDRKAGFGRMNLVDALRLLDHKLSTHGVTRWQTSTKATAPRRALA